MANEVVLQVTFRYKVRDVESYGTDDPKEMAEIDLESIENGDLDVSDLFDEDALDTVTIVPVEGS